MLLCLTNDRHNLYGDPCCCKWHYFILSVTESYATAFMYHIFSTHLSVNGYLGCFHVLAVVNSTAGDPELQISFQVSV